MYKRLSIRVNEFLTFNIENKIIFKPLFSTKYTVLDLFHACFNRNSVSFSQKYTLT